MKIFELIVLLSRYIFVINIFLFLLFGAVYVIVEHKLLSMDGNSLLRHQRKIVILTHIIGFLILSFDKATLSFTAKGLLIGGSGLCYFIIAYIAIHLFYKNSCGLMWNGLFFLLDVGLIMIYRLNYDLAVKQMIWFYTGFAFVILLPLVLKFIPGIFHRMKKKDYLYKFVKLEYVYLIVGLIISVLPFILGRRINGAVNWITVAGVSFQPSEIVKFLYVFYIASSFRNIISKSSITIKNLIPVSFMCAVFICILVLQRDLGGALVFFMTFLSLLYIFTGSELLILIGISVASVAAIGAYHLFSHVQVRVAAWLNPWADMDGGGYQILQSLFAIGTWGALGSGLSLGFPKYIPAVENDFIFAAISEEFGIFFSIGLICVFVMIFYRGVHIALRCRRKYYCLLASGFNAMLAFQTFLIIGGNIKLIPLTGVTLPFISYGGSSVIVSIAIIGILEWIYINNEKE